MEAGTLLVNVVKNIIVIADSAEMDGGATKVAIETAYAINAQGLKVVYFTGSGIPDSRLNGIEVINALEYSCIENPSKVKGALQGIWSIRAKKRLELLLESYDPRETVIHVHSWTHTLSSSIFSAAKQRGFSLVITLHDYFLVCPNGGFYDYVHNEICERKPLSISCIKCNCDKRSYLQKLYRCLRSLVQRQAMRSGRITYAYLSNFSFEVMSRQLSVGHSVHYLPNPVEINRNPDLDLRSIAPEHQGYIFVGRLEPEKNPRLFCEAISRAGVKGTVVGDGPLMDELIKEYPDICFAGWVPHESIHELYANHRALVLTSSCYETSSLVCLEAMLSGCTPVIIPETCAATSFVRDREHGLYFENKGLDSLIDAIAKMEVDDVYFSLRDKIDLDYPSMLEEYSVDGYINRVIALYQLAVIS